MHKFTKVEIKALTAELENLTTCMDIPFYRRTDAAWLLRNASINNPNHKNLAKVIKIATLLTGETNG